MKGFFVLREEMQRRSAVVEKTELDGKEYSHLELCPAAVAQFKQDLKGPVEKDKIHSAIKAVDDYLAIERRVKDKGSATEADVAAISRGIEKAKKIISAVGLKGHDYHQSHLDTVKDFLDK